MYVCMYTSEADFHKPGIYGGSVRVWAAAWDVFRRAPSRFGRGCWAAVDFVVCFGCGGIFSCFFPPIFVFFERTRPAASMRPPSCLIYHSTSTRPQRNKHRLKRDFPNATRHSGAGMHYTKVSVECTPQVRKNLAGQYPGFFLRSSYDTRTEDQRPNG